MLLKVQRENRLLVRPLRVQWKWAKKNLTTVSSSSSVLKDSDVQNAANSELDSEQSTSLNASSSIHENRSIMQTVDNEPWRTESLDNSNMWVTRPQFIYNMRVLMGLNETQKNLRELNKLYSSFDTKVQDMMNIREFCYVFVELREEKKRAVFGGMPDVSRFYDRAKSIFATNNFNNLVAATLLF